MYSQDNIRVMHPTDWLSARFSCGIAVKQGCPLSPLLFGLYLDGLEKHLDALDGDSPPQLADIVVKLLLYADDLALMSKTPQGLQKQIDVLFEFCVERQLVINVNKTKVVVFEKHRSAAPEFTYRGTTIERVQSFRYLGLELHSTRGMAVAIAKLTAVGKKALFALHRRCNDLGITDPEVMCQLFNSLVCLVLSYACEVWTGCTWAKGLQQAEQVHRMFMRGILGVNKKQTLLLCWGSLEGIHWSISSGNKPSSIMIDYGSPHQIACSTMPTRPRSRCSACSMITNSVGFGAYNCGLTTTVLGFSIVMSGVL
jgi:hypothetical protein